MSPCRSATAPAGPVQPDRAAAAAQFVVGQDPAGRWLAIEIHGRAGGLFRSRQDAVDYAEDETGHRPDAVFLSSAHLELRL